MTALHQEETAERLDSAYAALAGYAHTFDKTASLVWIRLKQAHQAVQDMDEKAFAELQSSILQTLDGHVTKIMQAREKMVPYLPGTSS